MKKTLIAFAFACALLAQQPPSPFNIPPGHRVSSASPSGTVVSGPGATAPSKPCPTVPFTVGFQPVFPQLLSNGQPDLNPSHTLVNDFAMDDYLHGRCYDAGSWEKLTDSDLWTVFYRSEALVGIGPFATGGFSASTPKAVPTSPQAAALAATMAELQKVMAALKALQQ